jgi:hypothetical protein
MVMMMNVHPGTFLWIILYFVIGQHLHCDGWRSFLGTIKRIVSSSSRVSETDVSISFIVHISQQRDRRQYITKNLWLKWLYFIASLFFILFYVHTLYDLDLYVIAARNNMICHVCTTRYSFNTMYIVEYKSFIYFILFVLISSYFDSLVSQCTRSVSIFHLVALF